MSGEALLVTGANGLLGARVCDELAARGVPVVGTGRGERRRAGPWPYEPADLAEADEVARLLGRARPAAVVHCAARANVDDCERHPAEAHRDNVLATAHLAETTRESGALLVHVSTDYVFDGTAGPYGEDDEPAPRGVYATAKCEAERVVRARAGRWAIARTSLVFGWPPAGRPNPGSWLVEALRAGRPVRLFHDQQVTPSLAASVAGMMADLALGGLEGVWHACGAETVDRVTFGRKLCAVFGFDPSLVVPVRAADGGLAAPRPLRGGLRADKAAARLATKPLPLAEALERFRRECDNPA